METRKDILWCETSISRILTPRQAHNKKHTKTEKLPVCFGSKRYIWKVPPRAILDFIFLRRFATSGGSTQKSKTDAESALNSISPSETHFYQRIYFTFFEIPFFPQLAGVGRSNALWHYTHFQKKSRPNQRKPVRNTIFPYSLHMPYPHFATVQRVYSACERANRANPDTGMRASHFLRQPHFLPFG